MTFYVLGACVALATFGAVSLAVSGALLIVWPLAKSRLDAVAPRPRGGWLLALRLAPNMLGALASASVALPSFLEFEPRDTAEEAGAILLMLAVSGLAVAALAVVRGIRSSRRTGRVIREWSRTAVPVALGGVDLPAFHIESALPIVALAGWRRPGLFLAGSVVDRCGRRLLLAMAAHEEGHRRSADNLKRFLLAVCADPLLACRAGREMVAAWEAAAEEAADDEAIASGARPTDLAAALVSVARLAPAVSWPALPGAAFCRDGSLDRRVRRMLEARPGPAPFAPRRRVRSAVGVLLLAAGWILAAESLHRPLHRLLEHAVTGPHTDLRALVVGHRRA
ncbi:MAG: hypothetical protein ACRD1B_04835 [Thermoanaerobaculia bacterium]